MKKENMTNRTTDAGLGDMVSAHAGCLGTGAAPRATRGPHSATRRGFTLVELMMAMAITAVVATSVAAVSLAMSSSYAHTQDYFQNVQSGRTAMSRLQDTLRRSKLVTSASGSSLVVWAGDFNGDGLINKGELVTWVLENGNLVEHQNEYDGASGVLDINQALSAATNITSPGQLRWLDSHDQPKVLAENVTRFVVLPNTPAPRTTMVNIELTVGEGNGAVTLKSAASLRADATSFVQTQGATSVLQRITTEVE